MYSNLLGYKYDLFSSLATNDSWFKNGWEFLHNINILATFSSKFQLSPLRVGDQLLMNKFSVHYSGEDLASLNRFCHHKKVVHILCIILCNGQTINKECLTNSPGRSNQHKFPLQLPTRADHHHWVSAIRKINLLFLYLPVPLGQYIKPPHKDF